MMTNTTTSNVEYIDQQGATTNSEASHADLITMLFDRAFGPYEIKVECDDEGV